MQSWMISANLLKYNHDNSFSENGYIDWIKHGNYTIGDVVYIYYSKPNIMELRKKCVVTKIHEDMSTVTNDSKHWQDLDLYKSSRIKGGFARLKPIENLVSPVSLSLLQYNGLKQAPQKVVLLNNKPQLLEFIEQRFESQSDLRKWQKEGERIVATIKSRRGQSDFRKALLIIYGGKCCISKSSVECILEAAHIVPHSNETNYSITNGLLLRADLHTLFDLHLIWIDETGVVGISEELTNTEYEKFKGVKALDNISEEMKQNLTMKLALKGT